MIYRILFNVRILTRRSELTIIYIINTDIYIYLHYLTTRFHRRIYISHLQRKRGATRTALLRLRVAGHSKARLDQLHLIVQRRSGTIVERYGVNHHAAIGTEPNVVVVQFGHQFEFVLEARASAAVHLHSQIGVVLANFADLQYDENINYIPQL